jgi:peptidyl-dipeptidase Dcp
LTGADRERYAAINKELAGLYTTFSNNVLADEEGYATFLDETQLGGLPESFTKAAAALAASKDQPGKYAVLNTRSSMDPFLTYSTMRDLREKVWRTYYSRGDNGDARDNNALITKILELRASRKKWPTCRRSPTPKAPASRSNRGTTASTRRRCAPRVMPTTVRRSRST